MFCKKILALILAAAMLAMAISGCTITLITNDGDDSGETGEATGEIGTGIESETSGSIANGETTAETEATTEEIAFEIELPDIEWEDYVPTNFGDATFTLDENRSTSSEYSPDGEAAITLSATDAAGLVWTLEIPAGSYYKAAEITMTPMTNVSVGGLGSLPGGVQLSPDGAVFSTPAKLTVSGPGIDDSIGMFQSGHDGSDVGYAEYENNGDSVTAYLRHFSSAYPGSKPPSDESRAAANTALAAASSYLSSRARLPSKDRYIESFYCPEAFNRPHRVNYNSHEEMYAETEALAYKYLHEEFLEPEITLIKELKAGINNIYAIEDPQSQQYAQTINALFSTLIDKYWELLMSYDEWSWRIVAVVTEFFYGFRHEIDQRIEEYKVSSLTEVQFMELLMATRNRTEMPSWWEGWIRHIANLWQEISEKDARILSDLFTVAERWAEETWNNHMGRLAEGHDFCIPHSLEEIAKYNRKAQVHYNYEDMITRALGFELEITIDLTDYYNRTDDMGVTSISAGGEAVGFFLEKNDAAGGIGYMQKGGKGTGH
ncbi:MAG: hypothetical protein FWH48_02785, partial [Oscillospiraceae bacterium]|nr:hypothetical protein [Oscillospiraceae bacterium]